MIQKSILEQQTELLIISTSKPKVLLEEVMKIYVVEKTWVAVTSLHFIRVHQIGMQQ